MTALLPFHICLLLLIPFSPTSSFFFFFTIHTQIHTHIYNHNYQHYNHSIGALESILEIPSSASCSVRFCSKDLKFPSGTTMIDTVDQLTLTGTATSPEVPGDEANFPFFPLHHRFLFCNVSADRVSSVCNYDKPSIWRGNGALSEALTSGEAQT